MYKLQKSIQVWY